MQKPLRGQSCEEDEELMGEGRGRKVKRKVFLSNAGTNEAIRLKRT